jgi:hypothetical protein
MWCSSCQQDVPGIAIAKNGNRIGCVRCSGALGTDTGPGEDKPAAAGCEERVRMLGGALDDWSLSSDLASVTRVMHSLRRETSRHALSPRAMEATNATAPTKEKQTAASARPNWLSWPLLVLGMMGFAGGGVLVGYSLFMGRSDLLAGGLASVMLGQGLLVFGLLLQLDGLWQMQQAMHKSMSGLEQELADLREPMPLVRGRKSAAV